MSDEDLQPINRIARALESISSELAGAKPAPRIVPPSVYLSGQWKRRDGTLYDTPMRGVRAAPNVVLDPQLRRDVPAVEYLEGQAGIDRD
jgi:hypothetical protein